MPLSTSLLGRRMTSFAAVAIFGSIALVMLAMGSLTQNHRISLVFYAAVVIASLGYLFWRTRDELAISVLSVFCVLFSAFHFGLLLADLTGTDVHRLFGGVLGWYLREDLVFGAYRASLLFLLGTVCGGLVAVKVWRRRPRHRLAIQPTRRRTARLVLLFLLMSVAAWLIIVTGILGIRNYTEYNFVARSASAGIFGFILMILYPLIAALFFLAVNASTRLGPPFLVFSVFGIVAFPMGLRGEVLFPLAMVVSVLVVQGRLHLSIWRGLAGAYAVSVASSFGRIFRADTDLSEAIRGASGVTGLAEMGGSLRPVVEVRAWLDSGADVLRWGETYYAPFERTVLRLFPIVERESALTDERLMNTLLVARTGGNYGFSIAAEALVNFGELGCVLIGAISGVLLVIYGRQIECGRMPIILSAVVFGLFIHIRQGFVTAYGSALLFLVICFLVSFLFERGIRLKLNRTASSYGTQ
ncbi:MAG: hypothetical protein CMI62_01700 [Parvibaculum sp.]|nr:hypothetical protein [Parvibaculum sp.]